MIELKPPLIRIDRKTPLSISEIMPRWSRGIVVVKDRRCLEIDQLDMNRVKFVCSLKESEERISFEEHLKRLEEEYEAILDFRAMLAILENPQHLSSESGESLRKKRLCFDGALVVSSLRGSVVPIHYTIYLHSHRRTWIRQAYDIKYGVGRNHLSAVLTKTAQAHA